MRFWIVVIAIIAVAGVAGKIAYDLKEAGKLETENKALKIENKEVKDEAQSYASRPRSNDDIVDSLCRWGKAVHKSEGKPKQSVPVHCR